MTATPLACLSAIGFALCTAIAHFYQMAAVDYVLFIVDWNLFLIWLSVKQARNGP